MKHSSLDHSTPTYAVRSCKVDACIRLLTIRLTYLASLTVFKRYTYRFQLQIDISYVSTKLSSSTFLDKLQRFQLEKQLLTSSAGKVTFHVIGFPRLPLNDNPNVLGQKSHFSHFWLKQSRLTFLAGKVTSYAIDWKATSYAIDWKATSYAIDWKATSYVFGWKGNVLLFWRPRLPLNDMCNVLARKTTSYVIDLENRV